MTTNVSLQSQSKKKSVVELYSMDFYLRCGAVGMLSSSVSHAIMTPVDNLKCNIQTQGLDVKTTMKSILERRSAWRGLSATFVGFGLHGFAKFALYESFKRQFALANGAERAARYRDVLYMSASCCSELLASVVLCPFVAASIRMQTNAANATPSSLLKCWRQIVVTEGVGSLYSGLLLLWSRQIPYTMMKFVAFERISELFHSALQTPRTTMSNTEANVAMISSCLVTGALASTFSHGADTLLTLTCQKPVRTNLVAESYSTLSSIGILALSRGLVVRSFMTGTMITTQLLIFSFAKQQFSLPTATVETK